MVDRSLFGSVIADIGEGVGIALVRCGIESTSADSSITLPPQVAVTNPNGLSQYG